MRDVGRIRKFQPDRLLAGRGERGPGRLHDEIGLVGRHISVGVDTQPGFGSDPQGQLVVHAERKT